MAARLAELCKTDKYAQLFARQVDPQYGNDWAALQTTLTEGARILKNYRPTPGGGMGQAQSNDYMMLGAFSYLIELWGRDAGEADLDGDGRVNEDEQMAWIDRDLTGEGWITPKAFQHPQLGKVWIGGTAMKHVERTPPARYMELEAHRNALYVMHCASQFPKVEVADIEVKPATSDTYWVEVTLKNDRAYPTSSDRMRVLGRVAKDTLTFSASSNVKFLEVPPGTVRLHPYLDQPAPVMPKPTVPFTLPGKGTTRFRALVQMAGSSGWVEFKASSTFAGSATRRLNLKVD